MTPRAPDPDESLLEDDPLWYRDAVVYELHVRAFHDSDGDGIGDFRGLTGKLDYLQELGVTAVWLLPFYPSPLRDDGYDIADYRGVHPDYGTLADFRRFLREAHRRGIRVITELVINHTSDQHAWFRRARQAKPGTVHRDFYVWSDDPERYGETRVIFQDFEPSNWTWDPVAGAYFWHRFYHHQPDLNFDEPAVHRELFRGLDYWLKMGVDGIRLDAIPYLYEREGTNCENLPETHAFLKDLRAHVDESFENRMLLAEANQWPEDAAEYFGDGDECHMNFHFPIMPRLFMAVRMEDRFPVVDILEETPPIPDGCQWAMFLRNHDELTLEMVTDEERDYMYRVYASDERARINLGIRRRLAPLLQNDRRKIELMNSLLFSLPGTPVLYYGDEIGMGDNYWLGDRNGVRTPMHWSSDRNAGFSEANPQRLYLPVIIDPEYHYESVNVAAQQANPSSLLWWMRRLIALRKRHRAFGRGTLTWHNPENRRVVCYAREHDGERILVVANLSRFGQAVELDLADFAGLAPVELFGRSRFPTIGEGPYVLTLGPHQFFWFALEPAREAIEHEAEEGPPGGVTEAAVGEGGEETLPVLVLTTGRGWEAALRGRARTRLEAALLDWVVARRWFGGKGRDVRSIAIVDDVPVRHDGQTARVLFVEVEYLEEEPETYVVPLAHARGAEAEALVAERPEAVVCRLRRDGAEGVLFDATARPAFGDALLKTIANRREFEGRRCRLVGARDVPAREVRGGGQPVEPRLGRAEQSNTSIIYGEKWILKLFRRLEEGVALDREIGRALTESGFAGVPATVGAIDRRRGKTGVATLAVLQAYVESEGDAWTYTHDALGRFYERALAAGEPPDGLPEPPEGFPETVETDDGGAASDDDRAAPDAGVAPDLVHERIGVYLESARLLGRRTAELHGALAAIDDPAFRSEPFTRLYRRSLYQSMRNLTGHTTRLLSRRRRSLPAGEREAAEAILDRRDDLLAAFRQIRERAIDGHRIRTHGDYHLGQILYTGKDFVVIDFEGEPARPLSERRLKRSPLRDVAGMLRSFHYAARAALLRLEERGLASAEALMPLEPWARWWAGWAGAAFLAGYVGASDGVERADGGPGDEGPAEGGSTGRTVSALLPSHPDDRRLLLDLYLLEKALYELRYELENRPGWVRIPVEGILQLLERVAPAGGAAS